MRYYIEEQVDYKWQSIKQYILDIKSLNTDELLDEIIKNIQKLRPNVQYPFNPAWIEDYKAYYKTHSKESLIAKAVEEKFYIFDDENEHEWNKHVVHSVLNRQGWTHRWDKTEYK